MSEPTAGTKKSRRQMLEEFIAQRPDDAFSRYGLALECMNSGDAVAADEHFFTLCERNPAYIPGYQMYGQFLVKQNRVEEARRVLRAGIAAAGKAGNEHARSEMEAFLNDLG